MNECLGCGKTMDDTLYSPFIHMLSCEPPGIFDLLYFEECGKINKQLGLWVGTSFDRLGKALR